MNERSTAADSFGPATAPSSFSFEISSGAVAGGLQHLVGVLAERRAGALRAARGAAELDREAEQPDGLARAGLVELDDHLALAHQLRLERLVELENRLEAAVVLGGELAPLVPRAPCEHRHDLPMGLGPGRLELMLDQVLAADPLAPRLPELRLERAAADVAVLARVGPVAEEAAREVELAPLGHDPVAKNSAATIASQEREPSVIETSTNWPSPERSRSRSAARIVNAAISPPPPRSAIWPADWTGRAAGLAGEAEQAVEAEVVHVVPGAVAVGTVLAVAGDRAVDEARVLGSQALVADAEAIEHAGAEALEHARRSRGRGAEGRRGRRPS